MSWPICPQCGEKTFCVDSRWNAGGEAVRRRYCCRGYKKHRWTTLEKIAQRKPLMEDRPITLNGTTRTVAHWAKRLKISAPTLMERLGKYSVEQALTMPKYPSIQRLRIVQ